jgi:hypothetical protein
VANWVVRPLQQQKMAKNVILFIGDGMTTNTITAAHLIAHNSINRKYQTKMQMDQFPVLGHRMVCSIIPSPNFQANLLRRLILSTATSPIPQIVPLPCTRATRAQSMPWVCTLTPVLTRSMIRESKQLSSCSLESGEVLLVSSVPPSSRMHLQLL